MQTITLIVNGAPYGTEGPYNASRLAAALTSAAHGAQVRIFLMADGVFAAKSGQAVPEGYYNAENMLADLIAKGVTVRLCGTCCKARGITPEDVTEGAAIGTMMELAKWVIESEKVIAF
jgi:uncharacterized protein involved in oxidation of intracellular sulfur